MAGERERSKRVRVRISTYPELEEVVHEGRVGGRGSKNRHIPRAHKSVFNFFYLVKIIIFFLNLDTDVAFLMPNNIFYYYFNGHISF